MRVKLTSLVACVLLLFCACSQAIGGPRSSSDLQMDDYDVVILGGRVMDPETGFDEIRNVGIKDGLIKAITTKTITGNTVLAAAGQVVTAGFVDTHWHGQDVLTQKLALRAGITTALELEGGGLNVAQWYLSKEGNSLYNYGITASHMAHRIRIHDDEAWQTNKDLTAGPMDAVQITAMMGRATEAGWSVSTSNRQQLNDLMRSLDEELRQGAIGVGSVPGYSRTGISTLEQYAVQKAAGNYGRLTSVHGRYYPSALTPAEQPAGFDEVFANALELEAPLLYCHMLDAGWQDIANKLSWARRKGYTMWGEIYPYIAASTVISAEYLQPETYEATGNQYGNGGAEGGIYDPERGKFYTREEFLKARNTDADKLIFAYYGNRSFWLEDWVRDEELTLATDGTWLPLGTSVNFNTPYEKWAGHPRTAGSHGKLLRLSRELELPLMITLSKMNYLPAKYLGDTGLKAMQVRGRMQEGMVADVVVFNPLTVTDNSTYKVGEQGLPVTGVSHVLVNGIAVVVDSQVREVYAGQPIRFPVEQKGRFMPLTEEAWIRYYGSSTTPR